jgi:hypothetical protein
MIAHRSYILFLFLLSSSLIIAERYVPMGWEREFGLQPFHRSEQEESLYQTELASQFMLGIETLNRYQVLSVVHKGFNLGHFRDPLRYAPTFKSVVQDGSKWERVRNTARFLVNTHARLNMADMVTRIQEFHQNQEKGLPEDLECELDRLNHNNRIAEVMKEKGFLAWWLAITDDAFDNGVHC